MRCLPGGKTSRYQLEAHKLANDRLPNDGFVIIQILCCKAPLGVVHHLEQTVGNLTLMTIDLVWNTLPLYRIEHIGSLVSDQLKGPGQIGSKYKLAHLLRPSIWMQICLSHPLALHHPLGKFLHVRLVAMLMSDRNHIFHLASHRESITG